LRSSKVVVADAAEMVEGGIRGHAIPTERPIITRIVLVRRMKMSVVADRVVRASLAERASHLASAGLVRRKLRNRLLRPRMKKRTEIVAGLGEAAGEAGRPTEPPGIPVAGGGTGPEGLEKPVGPVEPVEPVGPVERRRGGSAVSRCPTRLPRIRWRS